MGLVSKKETEKATKATFKEDLGPNEEWLQGKVKSAKEGGLSEFGVPKRMGSITGTFSRPLELPTYLLGVLKGEQGEQNKVRKESLDYIRKNWDKVKKEPIYVEVDPFGRAWVNEGNHRIMVARELGEKTLPVEVRYFSGGQKEAGPFEPTELIKLDEMSSKVKKDDISGKKRLVGKAGLMSAALGAAGGASASEIAESFLPMALTPSALAPGTLTPEQKAEADAAYQRKLQEEEAAKTKAQALLRSGAIKSETKMAKGGMMNRSIPGFQDGGNAVEPTTGNDVPIGSLPNEVADDIPARLSEGEFVLPADVVRFIGLERLMKLRDEAKEGLRRMAEVGQMGNAEEVGEKAEESFEEEEGGEEDTGKFESDIDEILSEVDSTEGQTEQMMADGGVVGTKTGKTTTAGRPVYKTKEGDNVSELSVTVPFKGFWANVPSIHNGVKYKEDQIVEMLEKGKIKPTSVHENISEAVEAAKKRSSSLMPKMAQGGVVGGAPWLTGFDLKKAPKNPVFDVRYYKHSDGRIMYVTFFNGKPMTPIPNGFTPTESPTEQQVGKEAEAKKPEEQKQMPDVGGGSGLGDGAGATGGPDVSAISKGDMSSLQMGTTVSPGAVKGAAAAASMVTGLPFGLAFMGDKAAQKAADALTMASGKAAGSQNIEAVGKAFGIDTSTTEGKAAASSLIDSSMSFYGGPTATTGAEGTGGAASRAGAEAAAQVGQLGLSSAAQGQAAQQAANAVIAGADPATAVSNAVDAAVNSAQGGSRGFGSPSAVSYGVADQPSFTSVDTSPNGGGGYGFDAGFGDGSGLGYKKGGLVSKSVKASKKYKGKGLAAR